MRNPSHRVVILAIALAASLSVSSAVAVDTDGDGLLDLLDAPGFDPNSINDFFAGLGIQDLDGANQLINIEMLYLHENQITSIERGDFDGLANLQALVVVDNQITSIESGDFDGPAYLWLLILSGNQITSLERGDFDGLANLGNLDLRNNQITSLENGAFDGLPNLNWLYLNDNQITSIERGDFDGLANLEGLILSGNQITSLESGAFDGLIKLQALVLDDNQITNIEDGAFAGLTNLHTLSLDEEEISELNLTGAKFEKLVECDDRDVPTGFCVDSEEITSLTLHDAVLSVGSFNVIVGATNSITDASLVGLSFSDENPSDMAALLGVGTLDDVTVDEALFDSYAGEFNSFAAKAGNTLTIVHYGDADRNGEFNTGDFVLVFQAGKYETGQYASWSEGDWNGDGVFDSADFVIAFQDGGYEQGPQTETVAEPSSWLLLMMGLFLAMGVRSSRCSIWRPSLSGQPK